MLRIGALLYALALVGCLRDPDARSAATSTASARCRGAASPRACCAGALRARAGARGSLLVLAPLLLYWQVQRARRRLRLGRVGPGGRSASYYAPLLGELRALGVGYGARPARDRGGPDARPLGGALGRRRTSMIARGWERQLDRDRNGLFYDGPTPLTPARYRAWLLEQAVSYVALPDAPLDYSAQAREARCCARAAAAAGLPARSLALGALAPVRGRRRRAARAAAGAS